MVATAAATQPDLVIHVGDYHYREAACPIDRRGCAGSPFGYGFDPWNADFFEPAAPLLAAAPWIMVRGNHEDCARAGEGWFRFLDRAPMGDDCRDLTGHFVARLGDFGVIVMDGGAASDPRGDSNPLADMLRRQFLAVAGNAPAETWIVSHRPLNAIIRLGGTNPRNVIDNHVQELAYGAVMPESVRMSVAGHIHVFEAIDFGGARPPQLVVGTGGDALDPDPMSIVGVDINGKPVLKSATRSGFGYMIWERSDADWIGTLYDVNAEPIDHCKLTGRSLSCGQ
jgi:predicted phosphodiesterase